MQGIKFRAWINWDERNPVMEYFDLFNRIRQYCDEDINVMKYIGIKDKMGINFYEDDIINHNGNIYVIKTSDNFGVIALATNENYSSFKGVLKMNHRYRSHNWIYRVSKYIEVIGNIHQNPELLK